MAASAKTIAVSTSKQASSLPLNLSASNLRVPRDLAILPVGTCRSVYLYSPTLKTDEMWSLGYHIEKLRANKSLSSILITCNSPSSLPEEENNILPRSSHSASGAQMKSLLSNSTNLELTQVLMQIEEEINYPPADSPVLTSVSENELLNNNNSNNKNPREINEYGQAYMTLSKAIRGNAYQSQRNVIPVVFVHHGLTTDGALLFNTASHVICTSKARYRIDNPLRGLSFDPIGFSFLLPRMNYLQQEKSAATSTTRKWSETAFAYAKLLSLSGYELTTNDILQLNLATNIANEPDDGIEFQDNLELLLSEVPSYQYQSLLKRDKLYLGQENNTETTDLKNLPYKNRLVQNLVNQVARSRTHVNNNDHDDQKDEAMEKFLKLEEKIKGSDAKLDEVMEVLRQRNEHKLNNKNKKDVFASLDSTYQSSYQSNTSEFLTFGKELLPIFLQENTVQGISERLRECYVDNRNVASNKRMKMFLDFVLQGIEQRSPLALCAINETLERAKEFKTTDSFETCMDRERVVWKNLCNEYDYKAWCAKDRNDDSNERLWKHAKFSDITKDEIEELFYDFSS